MIILGVEFSTLQLILIGALILVFPLGLFNQIRRNQKKERELEEMDNFSENYSSNNEDLDEESQQIKNYIENYKNSYSREAIRNALVSNGNSISKVDSMIEKYF